MRVSNFDCFVGLGALACLSEGCGAVLQEKSTCRPVTVSLKNFTHQP